MLGWPQQGQGPGSWSGPSQPLSCDSAGGNSLAWAVFSAVTKCHRLDTSGEESLISHSSSGCESPAPGWLLPFRIILQFQVTVSTLEHSPGLRQASFSSPSLWERNQGASLCKGDCRSVEGDEASKLQFFWELRLAKCHMQNLPYLPWTFSVPPVPPVPTPLRNDGSSQP